MAKGTKNQPRVAKSGEPSQQKRRAVSAEMQLAMVRAGEWMRAARVAAGVSQEAALSKAATGRNAIMSRMESGELRLSPPYYEAWSQALGIDPEDVARAMIGFYTPFLYEPLFGEPFVPQPPKQLIPEAAESGSLGEEIRMLRKKAGLSQDAIARLVGVSRQTIQVHEAGTVPIPPERLARLAEALGVPLDALQSRAEQAPPQSQDLSGG